jgi:hypothetical protein
MIRANFDLKFPLQIDSQEDNLEAKIENLQRQLGTMAAKKFRPSFFRHFKKIGVVHSLLSL